jgi:hypothetical protein
MHIYEAVPVNTVHIGNRVILICILECPNTIWAHCALSILFTSYYRLDLQIILSPFLLSLSFFFRRLREVQRAALPRARHRQCAAAAGRYGRVGAGLHHAGLVSGAEWVCVDHNF